MRFMFKCSGFHSRYDLKCNVNYGRVLYTTRTYTALVAWTEEGYSIIDFAEDSDKDLMKRSFDTYNLIELNVDCLLLLNCWDIMYLLENKDCHREEFLDMANVIDLNSEENDKMDLCE